MSRVKTAPLLASAGIGMTSGIALGFINFLVMKNNDKNSDEVEFDSSLGANSRLASQP